MDENPENLQGALIQLLQAQLEQQRIERDEDRQQQRQERDMQRAILQQQLDQQGQLLQALNIRNPNRSQLQAPPPVKSLPLPSLASPEDLTIAQFRLWKTKWEDYSSAQQLHNQSLATQQGVLRSALHDNWVSLWSSDRFTIDCRTSVATILNQFENYVRQRRNPLLDRQEFLRRDQHEGESIDQYYAALRLLDDACSYEMDIRCRNGHEVRYAICEQGDCFGQDVNLLPMLQEIRIRDRLICGLRNKATQRKILAEQYNNTSLTIEAVLSICTAHERSEVTTSSLVQAHSPGSSVHVVKSQYRKAQQFPRGRSPHRSRFQNHRQTSPNANRATTLVQIPYSPGSHACENCGFPINPTVTHRCPALNQKCTRCHQTGHWSRVCREEPTQSARPSERRSPSPSSSRSILRTSVVRVNRAQQIHNRRLLPITVQVGRFQQPISFLGDTGADADIMDEKHYLWISQYVEMSELVSLDVPQTQMANNAELPLVCKFTATLTLHGRSYQSEMFVSYDIDEPILSKTGCEMLGLIPSGWPHCMVPEDAVPQLYVPVVNSISTATQIIHTTAETPDPDSSLIRKRLMDEFDDVFDDKVLRPMKGPPMKIELVPGATPSKKFKAYTVPIHWQKPVKEQLDLMEQKGVIEKVPIGEPYEWCHPMVVVPKKGTGEPRITVDLTGLNKFVRRPAYPTRVPRDVVANIPPNQRFFSTLDARHGYWQVPLDVDSKKLTTFITPWGSYRYCRNVMGLISAGDEHNRRGDEAIQGIDNTAKVVEDVIIHDEHLPAHEKRVRDVLQRCRDHGITLNAKKFVFAQPQVEWCGFILNKEGYCPAPHLVSAIRNFPAPAYSGHEYLVVVDKYSGWPFITKLGSKATTQAVTNFLLQTFTDTGIPEIIMSDNGPQFSSLEFANWCKKWKITHRTSSPHFPQSNGLAESAVKAMKYLLAKTSPRGDCSSDEFRYGLLEFRNTPRADGYSPAQIVLGAPSRTLLPLHRRRYAREWRRLLHERDSKASKLEEKADARYNAQAQPLAELAVGDIVRIQDPHTRRWNTLAEIVEAEDPRSYHLRTEAGRILRRNRRFVRPYCAAVEPPQGPQDPPEKVLRRSPRLQTTHGTAVSDVARDLRSRTEKGDVGIDSIRLPHQVQLSTRSILKTSPCWSRSTRRSYVDAVKEKRVRFHSEIRT